MAIDRERRPGPQVSECQSNVLHDGSVSDGLRKGRGSYIFKGGRTAPFSDFRLKAETTCQKQESS